jgi:curli production assembly/transport component CsgE
MYAGKKTYCIVVVMVLTSCGIKKGCAQDTTGIKSDSLTRPKQDSKVDTLHPSKRQLQQFRKAFEKVVNAKDIQQKKKVKKDPVLDLGVLVFDRTRSPIGEQFYQLFYRNWKPPKNAGNATLTISEQPTPGIGSLVTIKLGYEKVFRARLQPRRRYIEALSKMAIARCQKIIEQKAKVKKQLAGY